MSGIDASKIAQEAIDAISEKVQNLKTLNIIVAGKTGVQGQAKRKKLRVAAYCRVIN